MWENTRQTRNLPSATRVKKASTPRPAGQQSAPIAQLGAMVTRREKGETSALAHAKLVDTVRPAQWVQSAPASARQEATAMKARQVARYALQERTAANLDSAAMIALESATTQFLVASAASQSQEVAKQTI